LVAQVSISCEAQVSFAGPEPEHTLWQIRHAGVDPGPSVELPGHPAMQSSHHSLLSLHIFLLPLLLETEDLSMFLSPVINISKTHLRIHQVSVLHSSRLSNAFSKATRDCLTPWTIKYLQNATIDWADMRQDSHMLVIPTIVEVTYQKERRGWKGHYSSHKCINIASHLHCPV
jgi:hypothetical protein